MTKRANKNNKTTWIIFSVFLILIMSFMLSAGQSVSYDFSKTETVRKWRFFNINPQKTDDGIKISTKQTSLMLISELSLQDKSWQDYPYVVLKIVPAEDTRRIILYWVPGKNKNNGIQLPVTIDAFADEIIINTQQQKMWERMPGWNERYCGQAKINSFGFLIPANKEIEIKSIDLQSKLNLLDLAGLIAGEYWTFEPVKGNSINCQYGTSILGQPLACILGVFLVVLGFVFLINRNKFVLFTLFVGGVVCFIVYDMTLNHTVFEHAKYSSERSAWHNDKYEEYRSRFGQQFADLADKFEEIVPLKSKVTFPWTKDYRVRGESNWLEFQYYALYQPGNIKTADYIFYYYPRKLIYDSEDNSVYFQGSQDRYKVKVLYSQSPSVKILKVLHD